MSPDIQCRISNNKQQPGYNNKQGKWGYWDRNELMAETGRPNSLSSHLFNKKKGYGYDINMVPTWNEIEIVGFSDLAPKKDFSGFWGQAEFYLNGGHFDGYKYNNEGEATGLSPVMGIAPDVGFGKLLKAAKYGREMHRLYNPGSQYILNKAIPKSLTKWRPDAVDYMNNIVRELKPSTLSGLRRGKAQLKRYIDELEKVTGEKLTGILDDYIPR